MLKNLAAAIEWFFPGEKAPVYYIACEKKKGHDDASGKLYHSYVNNRKRNPLFRKQKNLENEPATKGDTTNNTSICQTDAVIPQEGVFSCYCERSMWYNNSILGILMKNFFSIALEWLSKPNLDAWENIEICWTDTFYARQNLFKDKKFTIHKYYEWFST